MKNERETNVSYERKLQLFRQQKELLDTFLAHGAITQAQYNKSYGDLIKKIGIKEEDRQ